MRLIAGKYTIPAIQRHILGGGGGGGGGGGLMHWWHVHVALCFLPTNEQ